MSKRKQADASLKNLTPGNPGNKGKPVGASSRAGKKIRKLLMEALESEKAGKGVEFLKDMKQQYPKEFLGALTKLLPKEQPGQTQRSGDIIIMSNVPRPSDGPDVRIEQTGTTKPKRVRRVVPKDFEE